MSVSVLNQELEFKRGFGLKFKFSLAIIILIIIMMSLVTFVVRSRVRDTLLSQMQVKGMALARGLAGNAAEALVTADRLLLAELVDKAGKQEEGILYAVLVDKQGHVLAHSNFKLEGRSYQIPAGAVYERVKDGKIIHYTLQGEECLDFEVPIILAGKIKNVEKIVGAAHVVYSLLPIRRLVYETLQNIFYIAAACLGLGIFLVLFLVSRIIRPVKQLAEAAEEVGAGNLDLNLEVRRCDELGQLAATFNHMAANLKLAQVELIVKERLQHEMEIAQHIQNLLVPKHSPQIPGYSISMLYRSAEEVSGDYFDFIDLGRGYWGMTIADVSGKGVPGALVMAQTRSVMRSIAHVNLSPAKVLSQANLNLYRDMRDDMFVTVSYFVLDSARRMVTLSRAGHLAAIIYRRATKTCELEMPTGIAIGISDPDTFDLMLNEKKIKLNPGDFILLYTDGVDEACNRAQELFGSQRLLQTLIKSAHLKADGIINHLDQAVQRFVGEAPQHDDITMILVKVE